MIIIFRIIIAVYTDMHVFFNVYEYSKLLIKICILSFITIKHHCFVAKFIIQGFYKYRENIKY